MLDKGRCGSDLAAKEADSITQRTAVATRDSTVVKNPTKATAESMAITTIAQVEGNDSTAQLDDPFPPPNTSISGLLSKRFVVISNSQEYWSESQKRLI